MTRNVRSVADPVDLEQPSHARHASHARLAFNITLAWLNQTKINIR